MTDVDGKLDNCYPPRVYATPGRLRNGCSRRFDVRETSCSADLQPLFWSHVLQRHTYCSEWIFVYRICPVSPKSIHARELLLAFWVMSFLLMQPRTVLDFCILILRCRQFLLNVIVFFPDDSKCYISTNHVLTIVWRANWERTTCDTPIPLVQNTWGSL